MTRVLSAALTVLVVWQLPSIAQESDPTTWPESLDAVTAAPQSHEVLFENEDVRLLSVTILPGEEEPLHHHRSPSVIVVDGATQLVNRRPDGWARESNRADPDAPFPAIATLEPEPVHAVENTDSIPFHLYRLEFKNLEFRNQGNAAE